MEDQKLRFGAEDRVLGGFGHLELHDALGRNLDLLAGGGIAAETGGAVFQFQFAEAGQRELCGRRRYARAQRVQ